MDFAHILNPVAVQEEVARWLKEDIPSYDVAGAVVGTKVETASILCKTPGVIAGVPFINAVFKELGCNIKWLVDEGEMISHLANVAVVTGPVKNILLGERLSLNILCRASGIATAARELKNIAKQYRWHGEIAGTRKTTPGFRMVEKYSLLVGGMATHRYDLSSMVMLKDNHIWSADGDIVLAVERARSVCGFSSKIEVECRSYEEAHKAASAGCEIVMLDNFEPDAAKSTAAQLKKNFPNLIIDVSGGLAKDTIKSYFCKQIDVLSLGSATQGYKAVDFSMKILKDGHDPANPVVKFGLSAGDSSNQLNS